MIAYTKSHRTIGEHAMMGIRKHINTTFMYLSRLTGMKFETIYAKEERNFTLTSYENLLAGNNKENILYRLDFLKDHEKVNEMDLDDNKNDFFPAETLLGGYLNKIKNNFLLGKDLISFTFAVPDYFTIRQRESLSRAIKICQLDNFQIINESTAITLYYGYNRYKDLFMEPEAKLPNSKKITDSSKLVVNPHTCKYEIFIDFGHSKISMVLSEFRPTNFRVINSVLNPFLGGRNIDKFLFDYLVQIFCKKYKIDSSKNVFNLGNKTSIRLIEQITKAKKVLSANQETNISVDAFYDDYDLSYAISRKEFEGIIQPVLDVFASMFEDFYKKSMTMIDRQISSIEIAGETMRIPLIAQIVKNISGKELGRSIIVDECISKGSSFYSALSIGILPIIGFNTVLSHNYYVIYYVVHSDMSNIHVKDLLINRSEPVPIMKSIILGPEFINTNRNVTDLKITLFHIKEDVVYFNNNDNIIIQYELNLKELLNVNKITNIDKNTSINLNFFLDQSSKPSLNSISMSNKNLIVNLNIILKAHYHPEFLITDPEEDKKFVEFYTQVENAHLKQDINYVNYFKVKNQLESNLYKIKNKYVEKQGEYDKLKYEEHITDKRPIIKRLDSVEFSLTGDIHEMDYALLEKASQTLKEIEKILNESANKRNDQSLDIQNVKKEFREKINYYSHLIDKEYVKHLQGEKSNLDVSIINRVSDILHKYGLLMNKSQNANDLNNYIREMEKEIKLYIP